MLPFQKVPPNKLFLFRQIGNPGAEAHRVEDSGGAMDRAVTRARLAPDQPSRNPHIVPQGERPGEGPPGGTGPGGLVLGRGPYGFNGSLSSDPSRVVSNINLIIEVEAEDFARGFPEGSPRAQASVDPQRVKIRGEGRGRPPPIL